MEIKYQNLRVLGPAILRVKIPDEILYAYNVYQVEGEGRNLFATIEGDKETIMGLPIKKIKEYLSQYK